MRILQLSTAVPKNAYSTEQLLQRFPCELPDEVKRNVLNLGVSKRYLINTAKTSSKTEAELDESALVELCAEACRTAVEKTETRVDDVCFLVAAYDISPMLCPGVSQLLAREIGLDAYKKNVNVQGMACTAFPIALELAGNYLAAHPDEKVLLCVSGVNSYGFQNQVNNIDRVMEVSRINKLTDETERARELRKWIAAMEFFLFGDGAAAAVIAKQGEGLTIRKSVEVTNIRKNDYLAGFAKLTASSAPFRFGLHSHLDKQIPQLGVEYTNAALKQLLRKDFEQATASAKKWAFHTGSEKILNELANHYHISHEKLEESYYVLRNYGNLAAASLPFILERIVSTGSLSRGDTALMVGYGWGFAASAALLEFTV